MEQNVSVVLSNFTSNSSNPLIPYQVKWTQGKIFWAILLGSFSIITVSANLFVLYLFARGKRSLRAPSHYLLANLAVADLMVGAVVMPILATLVVFDSHWLFGPITCAYFDHTHFMLCATSTMSIVAVSLERYIGVNYPLRHRKLLTKRRLAFAILGIWILSLTMTWTPLTVWRNSLTFVKSIGVCLINLKFEVTMFVSVVIYTIPICITLCSYLLIYWTASKSLDKSTLDARMEDKEKLLASRKKQTALAKKMFFPVALMAVMFGPVFFMFFLSSIHSPYFSFELLFLAGWIRYLNSMVNPFVYALSVPAYKKGFYEVFLNDDRRQGLKHSAFTTGSSSMRESVMENPDESSVLGFAEGEDSRFESGMALPVTKPAEFNSCIYCNEKMSSTQEKRHPYCTVCMGNFTSGLFRSSPGTKDFGNVYLGPTVAFDINNLVTTFQTVPIPQRPEFIRNTGNRIISTISSSPLKNEDPAKLRVSLLGPIVTRRSQMLKGKEGETDWSVINELDEIINRIEISILQPLEEL